MIQTLSDFTHQISRKRANPLILKLRRLAANILCNDVIGQLIALISSNNIHNGNCIINTNCETVKPSVKARLFWGVYETPEIDFVNKYLRSDLDVIELGSSIGVIASHVGQKLKSSSRLICVEANPILIDCLKDNIQRNINEDNVDNYVVINAAIDYSNNSDWVEFAISNNSLESRIGNDLNAREHIKIPTTTLSNILHEYQIDKYTLICDIEGAEKQLLENEHQALEKCQQLHIEVQNTIFDGHIIKIEDIVNILINKHGFSVVDNYLGAYIFERK
jgi:FkbM family methyltransferase